MIIKPASKHLNDVILSPSLFVILSEAKNLAVWLRINSAKNLILQLRTGSVKNIMISMCCKTEILRLGPQDDILPKSPRQAMTNCMIIYEQTLIMYTIKSYYFF